MTTLQRSPQPALQPGSSDHTPPLRLVFWESTTACNLRCRHCRRLETDDASALADLSTDEAYAFIDDLASLGKPILVLSGGEPLMRKDCFDLIARAKLHGIPVALATNGTLVDRRMAERIAQSGVKRVSISIDGADAETHDGLRGIQGSFASACAALRCLSAAGVSTQINATITRLNAHQRDALYALSEELEVDALHCFILVPVGCGAEIKPELRLTPGELENFLLWLHDKANSGSLFVKATCAPQYHRILHRDAAKRNTTPEVTTHGMSATTKGCLAGSGVCFVSHRGEVFPCGYLPLNAGDITQEPLSTIWQDSLLFNELRDGNQLKGRCGSCSYQDACGGCRARAYAATGDCFAGDDSCPHTPTGYRSQNPHP